MGFIFLIDFCWILKKLQTKWKVSAVRLLLIISTFAIGGSLCAYSGRKLFGVTNIEKGFLWVLLYIITISILWPIAIILVSIPLGQFFFFKRYLSSIYEKISGKKKI